MLQDDEYDDEEVDNEEGSDNDDEDKYWQAEEATKTPETLTEMKWRLYGSRKGVEESRRNHQQASSAESK